MRLGRRELVEPEADAPTSEMHFVQEPDTSRTSLSPISGPQRLTIDTAEAGTAPSPTSFRPTTCTSESVRYALCYRGICLVSCKNDCESGGLDPGSQYGERSDPYFHRPQPRLGVCPSHTPIPQPRLFSLFTTMSPGSTRGGDCTSLPAVATYRQPGPWPPDCRSWSRRFIAISTSVEWDNSLRSD